MGTFVCTVEMDKTGGITVTLDNPDANIKQTVKMNGTTIELKVAGDSGTSTITQSQEKVSISCKQFEVTAEETVSIKSDGTMTLQSAKDMTQKSDANVKVEGQTQVALTGGSQGKVTLKAAEAKMEGPKVSLEAQGQLAGKAPQVQIKSDAMMSLESSGIATLKGSLTNVQGNLVNLG